MARIVEIAPLYRDIASHKIDVKGRTAGWHKQTHGASAAYHWPRHKTTCVCCVVAGKFGRSGAVTVGSTSADVSGSDGKRADVM